MVPLPSFRLRLELDEVPGCVVVIIAWIGSRQIKRVCPVEDILPRRCRSTPVGLEVFSAQFVSVFDIQIRLRLDLQFADGALTFSLSIDAGGQMLDLDFTGTIDGDSLSGKFGSMFGDFTATGSRVE